MEGMIPPEINILDAVFGLMIIVIASASIAFGLALMYFLTIEGFIKIKKHIKEMKK